MLSLFSSGNQKLLEAAKVGDVSEVSCQLAKPSVDKNFQDKDGRTALMWAAINGNLEILDELGKVKANATLQDKNGKTARDLAKNEITRSILAQYTPAPRLVPDSAARPPVPQPLMSSQERNEDLIAAAKQKNRAAVTALLARPDVDKNYQGEGGDTALILATGWRGDLVIVKMLVQAGADVNLHNDDGRTALMQAVNFGHLEIAKVLILAGTDNNLQDKYGWMALMWAAVNGHLEVVQALIRVRANVNLQDEDGTTALTWAAYHGHLEVVKMLVQANANVNLQDRDGYTTLQWAARAGHLDIVKVLVDGRAGVNMQNKRGWTPLLWAARECHAGVVAVLVQAKADMNHQNKDGYAALMLACNDGHLEVVKILLKANADVNLPNKIGETALIQAVITGRLELVKLLVHQSADVNLQDKDGDTALMHAAGWSGRLAIVKVLVEVKANVNLQNHVGRTALMQAAKFGHLEIANLLLQANSDVDLQDKDRKTARDLAKTEEIRNLLSQQQGVGTTSSKAKGAQHIPQILNPSTGAARVDAIPKAPLPVSPAFASAPVPVPPHSPVPSSTAAPDRTPAPADVGVAVSGEPFRASAPVTDFMPSATEADLTVQVQQLLVQAAGVQARREWMQRRDTLQAQKKTAKAAKNFTEVAKLGKAITACEAESATLSLSVEDYATLASRHQQLVCVLEGACEKTDQAEDFDALESLSQLLESLQHVDVGFLCVPTALDTPITPTTDPWVSSSAKEAPPAAEPMAEFLSGNTPVVVTGPLKVSAARSMYRGYFQETTISSARKSATVTELQCVIKCALRGGATGEPLAASIAALRDEHTVYDYIQGRVRSAQDTGCVHCYPAHPSFHHLVLEDHGQDINGILNHQLENRHQVVYAIVGAVQALHSLGVMHGDIKPHNMLYRYNSFGKCEVKLCDLDCAQKVGEECLATTLGTEFFHAPEVYHAARRNASIRAVVEIDLFPLGLVLWQVLQRSDSPALSKSTSSELADCYANQAMLWERLPLPPCAQWSHQYLQSLTSLEPHKRMSASALLQSIQVLKGSSAQQGWFKSEEQTRNLQQIRNLQLSMVDKLDEVQHGVGEANAKLDRVLEVLQTKFDALGQEVMGVAATLRKEMLLGREHGQVLEGMIKATQDTLQVLSDSAGDGQCASSDRVASLLNKLQVRVDDTIAAALTKRVNDFSASDPSAVALSEMSTQFQDRFTALNADLRLFMDDQRRAQVTSATAAQDLQRQTQQMHQCLTSSLKDVLKGMSTIRQEVAQLKQGQEQLGTQVSVLLTCNAELSAMMNTLISGTHTIPTLAIILPVVSTSWRSILSPMRLVRNKYRLYFLCSHTHRIATCGPKGEGYKIKVTKQWVQDAAPVLRVGLVLVKLALLAGGLPLPVPDLPSLLTASGLHAKYLDAALHLVQNPADDHGASEFDMDKAIDKLVSLEERHLLQEQGMGEGGMTMQEGSRKAYETIQEVLAKDGVNIALTSGLRQVTHRGRTAWVLDNSEVEAHFRESL